MNDTRISNFLRALIFCLIALPSTLTAQQVFKCKDASGKIVTKVRLVQPPSGITASRFLRAPALTEEKFNAYAAGTTPSEARRLCRVRPRVVEPSRQTNPAGRSGQAGAVTARREAIVAMTSWLMTCESEIRPAGQGNLAGRLVDLRARQIGLHLWGGGSRRQPSPRFRQRHRPCPPSRRRRTVAHQLGQCQGGCASEQSMCIAQCQGNGSRAFPTARPAMVAAWPVAPPTDRRGLAAGQGDTDSRPAHHTRWRLPTPT